MKQPLISTQYAQLNAALHDSNPLYGTSSQKWAQTVRGLARSERTVDILDYGCGKQRLQSALPEFKLKHYDPGIPGLDEPPLAADIVVCTDVLEHIEPELLDNVLDHLASLTLRVAFLTVATRPAVKVLADGRNAHLIQEPMAWWLPKFEQRFAVIEQKDYEGQEFSILVRRNGTHLSAPPFTSYAQNFEDIMLWRALKQVSNGRYVDVGAQHPVIDSVSKAFYERGWRGIHIETIPQHADLLRKDRPDETILQMALSDRNEAMTLEAATATLSGQEVHWLKIDVEGREEQVLQGWNSTALRPWIIVIAAAGPRSARPHYPEAARVLIAAEYRFAYFDGINRFYVAKEHAELIPLLETPPNFLDEAQLSGTSGPWCRGLNARHQATETAWADSLAASQAEAARSLELAAQAELRAAQAAELHRQASMLQLQASQRATQAEKRAARAEAAKAEAEQLAVNAQAQASAAEQRLHVILNTASWRITAPGRWLRVSLRKLESTIRKTRLISGLKRRQKESRTRRTASSFTPIEQSTYKKWIDTFETLTATDRSLIDWHIQQAALPEVLVLWMLDTEDEAAINVAVDSLRRQLHHRWRCVLYTGQSSQRSSGGQPAKAFDARISIRSRPADGDGAVPEGQPVLLLQGQGALAEHATYLYSVALAQGNVNSFSDQDVLIENELRRAPRFAPAYSKEFPAVASIGMTPMTGEIASLINAEQRRTGTELSLALSASFRKAAQKPTHIPFILFHARLDLLYRYPAAGAGIFSSIESLPTISIIIPTRDRLDLLKPCLTSIFEKTDYPKEKYDILVVDNGSTEPELIAYVEKLDSDGRIKLLRDPLPFNYARINNQAVKASEGRLLAFVNNDIVVNDASWLLSLASSADQLDVGAVGCKLIYPDMTVQHGGIILGVGGVATHAHHHLKADDPGYMGLSNETRQVSAVTGACIMMRRSVFDEIGGFDEELAVAFNDVVLCLSASSRGYRNVYVGKPFLIHYESKTRGLDNTEAKQRVQRREARYARSKYRELFKRDPFYNENLSLERAYDLASPPRMEKPWHRFRRESSQSLNVLMLSGIHQIGHHVAVVVDQQARYLASQGHSIFIGGPAGSDEFEYSGCHRVQFDGPKEAAEFAMRQGMDCVVMHTPPFYSTVRWLGSGVKTLAFDHGEPDPNVFPDAAARRASIAEKVFCLEMADAPYAISEAVRAEAADDRMGVIALGNSHLCTWGESSSSRRLTVRTKHGWDSGKIIVLNVSNFRRAVRHRNGINQFSIIRNCFVHDFPDAAASFIFCLAGKGLEEDAVEMEARGLRVFANVTEDELIDLYHCADIYANFSKWEGYNFGIGEALAMGLPVVASDIPAHQAFGVFTSNDTPAAAAKLHEYAQGRSPQRMVKIFPWSEHLERVSGVITRLCLE